MKRASSSRREGGFSLVEVLVSIVLLAMMLAMLPTVLQLARRAWQGSEGISLIERRSETRMRIAELISASVDTLDRDASGVHGNSFRGTENALTFVSEDRRGPFGGGLYRFTLGMSGEGGRLMLKQQRFTGALSRASQVEPFVEIAVLEHLADLRIRYWETRPQQRAGGWVPRWEGRDNLPALVELEITSASGESMIEAVSLRMR